MHLELATMVPTSLVTIDHFLKIECAFYAASRRPAARKNARRPKGRAPITIAHRPRGILTSPGACSRYVADAGCWPNY
jgi:hypothetical protein